MFSLSWAATFGAGIAAHLLYFKHSEHHLYPLRYVTTYFLGIVALTVMKYHYLDELLSNALRSSSSLGGLFLAGTFLSVTIFRLFFNPLNAIPGPYSARLTKFSASIRNSKLDGHHQLRRLHAKYGKFVRLGPNDISVTDPDGTIVISGPQTKCTKAAWYDGDHPLQSMHTTREKGLHDRRRRVWSPAFSDKALRGYEKRVQVYNDLLVQQIAAFSGKTKFPSLFRKANDLLQASHLMPPNGSTSTPLM